MKLQLLGKIDGTLFHIHYTSPFPMNRPVYKL